MMATNDLEVKMLALLERVLIQFRGDSSILDANIGLVDEIEALLKEAKEVRSNDDD